jgi:hypothetical protein
MNKKFLIKAIFWCAIIGPHVYPASHIELEAKLAQAQAKTAEARRAERDALKALQAEITNSTNKKTTGANADIKTTAKKSAIAVGNRVETAGKKIKTTTS